MRLFAVLVAATGVVWLAAAAWVSIDSRARFEAILDRRLMEAARMVDSLFISPGGTSATTREARIASLGTTISYDRHLSCQIWSLDGRLVGASSGAPDPSLTDQHAGFSNRFINGQAWRVFALSDPSKGFRILVGDNVEQRRQLERGLVDGLLLTAAGVLPALALLIWFLGSGQDAGAGVVHQKIDPAGSRLHVGDRIDNGLVGRDLATNHFDAVDHVAAAGFSAGAEHAVSRLGESASRGSPYA